MALVIRSRAVRILLAMDVSGIPLLSERSEDVGSADVLFDGENRGSEGTDADQVDMRADWPDYGGKEPDADPVDIHGHGTHVAGIIAGKTDL